MALFEFCSEACCIRQSRLKWVMLMCNTYIHVVVQIKSYLFEYHLPCRGGFAFRVDDM